MNKLKNIGIAILLIFSASCSEDQIKENGLLDQAPEDGGNITATNPFWSWVGNFPGWISPAEKRETLTSVEINGVYEKMDAKNRIGFQQTPWFSTGFYAAPGETVTIVKPAGVTGKTKWRIGAWNCILPTTAILKRYNKVYEEGELTGDTTKAMSYFGGNLYIVPEDPFTKPETFQIGGAVKSPDFISGKTDIAAWKEALKNTNVPFAELIGKRCIWTMPVSSLIKIDNPQELLDFYDDAIVQDFNALHGFSDNATDKLGQSPTFPARVVQDLQLCTGTSHTGYPIMLDMSDAKIGIDVDEMRSSNVALPFYRELGRNYQTWCWTWLGVKEISNLLPYYRSRSRILKNWSTTEITDWDLVISDYVKKTSTDKDFEMGTAGIGEQLNKNNARLMPFIQLAQKYGWKLYAYIGKCSRELSGKEELTLKILSTQGRREFFCKRVCEYANADLSPFFDAWGIKYSTFAAADMKKLPAYTGEKFWEQWNSTLMPDFDIEQTPSTIKLPNDNYNNVATQLDQTKWSVDTFSGKALEGTPTNVINGKYGKDDKVNYHWVSESVKNRPKYTPQPWLSFDMGMIYTIHDTYVVLRNNKNNARFQPKFIDIHVKIKSEDEWKPWGRIETQNLAGALQNLKVKMNGVSAAPIDARYIKIIFAEGHGTGTDSGGVSFDEFSLGGTLYISDDTEISGDDSDFPVWN